jgi:group I intron endonuclease
MQALIYKITNPNGKVYIGSTINLKDRIYRYKTNRVKQQIKISRSIEKYGWDKHLLEVIFTCDISERYFYENKFGIEYDVLGKKGLNCNIPKSDDSYICVSEETRKKIGLAHKGKTISEEQKKQISINSSNWLKNNKHPMTGATPWNKGKSHLKGEKNPMYGVRRSDEWKAEHSKRMKEKNPKGENHSKSVKIVNYINGECYFSIKEASEKLNITYSTLKGVVQKKKINKYNICYLYLKNEILEKLKQEYNE